MVLQAYIDESIDDGGLVVLAGYISTSERWAAFSRDWEQMLPQATPTKDGKYRFKMSEMAYSGRMDRVSGFYELIQTHAIMGVSSIVDSKDLERAKARITVDHVGYIDWREANSPYYMAYRGLMDNFHAIRARDISSALIPDDELSRVIGELQKLDGPVDFYFDENSDKKMILEQWDEYLQSRPPEFRKLYGSQPRFESDDVFLPLQAADLKAWWARKWVKEFGFGRMKEGKYDFQTSGKLLPQIGLFQDEDQLVKSLKTWLGEGLTEDFRIHDSEEFKRIDPPSPVERFASYLGRLFRRNQS